MSIDVTALGCPGPPVEVCWTPDDVILYALSVGAGLPDPTAFLDLTTENGAGRPLRVLPSFAALLASRVEPAVPGDLDGLTALHAGMSFELARSLEPQGRIVISWELSSVVDRPKGAVIAQTATARDPDRGDVVFTATSTSFIVGAVSGVDAEAIAQPGFPTRDADVSVKFRTSPDQALQYRLTGDRNPLHTDPLVAARGGFERPILHGMCTYGITARIAAQAVFAGDPCRLRAMTGRFTAPVWPGDVLVVECWIESEHDVRFQTRSAGGDVVIDHGRLTGMATEEARAHGRK